MPRKRKKPPISEELRQRLRRWMPPPKRVFKDRKKEQSKRACRDPKVDS